MDKKQAEEILNQLDNVWTLRNVKIAIPFLKTLTDIAVSLESINNQLTNISKNISLTYHKPD